MYKESFQEILAQVQTPTRYAGTEINAVKKDLDAVDLTFALAFPDLYEIGTSHFGLQILYSILNNRENIAAERFFTPAEDLEALMRERGIPSLSMESKRDLKTFDVIGVSLLYELNFTNILTLFDLSGIPFYATDRDDTFPLIIAGGPCAFNPEPLADFFDAFVIGDGEETVLEVADAVMAFKKEGDGKKESLLRILSKIQGVYVPAFFEAEYDDQGLQTLTPKFEDYTRVKRAFLSELTKENCPTTPIVPYAKPVHDRLRLEIARGCTRGCRFCQAGMIYRPVRERSVADLVDITKESLKATGYTDTSLLSLSTGDYSRLTELMQQLLDLNQGHCNAISLPSIRAERLTPELMDIIKTVRKTGFTIAPEAGTQRLRDIINKNLSEESIENTVKNAMDLGWKNIKLYFMNGLPFEEMEDLEGLCSLSKRLASTYCKGKKNINVSTTCFIPKAHTPFQRHAQMTMAETQDKLQFLKENLRHPKVNLKWQDPKMSLLEGAFARGDRRLSAVLVEAFNRGCRLDGWSDRFDFDTWQAAFEATGIDPEFYTSRVRSEDEPLPWDHIDSGVSARFLKKEFERAAKRAITPDCRENDCTGCGVCDFKTIKPVLHGDGELPPAIARTPRLPDEAFAKFQLTFTKLDSARFFGHLELATVVQRAVIRAGLNVKYSQGFNPSMRLSFETALPVGMESEAEKMFIYLEKGLRPKAIAEALNKTLPEGVFITDCRFFSKNAQKTDGKDRYRIRFTDQAPTAQAVEDFLEQEEFIKEDLNKRGKVRKTDLRKAVEYIRWEDDTTWDIGMQRYNERTIRPTTVLTTCFGLSESDLNRARIIKLK
ncbi:MAG: TIGR03960 family B12-binding radical SAM protein [Desulfobacterales bacterium]|nr:TIGR03960 family B12-binding radical SAM protein [Desulfobacterales bacterium]